MWVVLERAGQRIRVAVARAAQGVWVGYPGGATLVAKAERASKAAAHAGLEVRAPMTGKVVSVHAAAGDSVESGAVLIVLEAMKMEYRLSAPKSAQIADVFCEPGQLVDLGAILVTLTA